MKISRRAVLRTLGGLPLAATGCRTTARGPGAAPVAFGPSPTRTFAAPARVLLYGDSRGRIPLEFWREHTGVIPARVVAQAVAERADLVIHAGDLVETGSPASWSRFDDEVAPLRTCGVPFFPILGNHEFFGEGDTRAALARYHARFPALEGRRWYDLRVGPLLFVLVDTNAPELTRGEVEAQDAWYRDRLARADDDPSVRWVVVVGHHPPMTNAGVHRPDAFTNVHFATPALEHAKFAAFVAGHVHTYERFRIDGRQFLVSGGGGSPRVHLVRDHRWRDEYRGGPIRPFHYLRFDVRPDRCDVEIVMLDPVTCAWTVGDGFGLGLA